MLKQENRDGVLGDNSRPATSPRCVWSSFVEERVHELVGQDALGVQLLPGRIELADVEPLAQHRPHLLGPCLKRPIAVPSMHG